MISVLERSRAAKKELEVAHRRLQEAQVLAAIGTAATKIIHDMTNSLNAISTTIQLEERHLARDSERLPELTAGAIQDLKEETNRVRALIEELRHFSQPLHLKLESVNLAQILSEVIHETICARNHADSVEIEQQFSEDLPTVMADGEKLRRVLLNLFNNALEAMPKGGKLTAKCHAQVKNICLEIEDTGCGIPKEMNVFEPFTTSKPHGWGLGLAIAQQIISAHKGSIDYNSERGQGTTFKIFLPIYPPRPKRLDVES
jgi:two-component system NtrC family sensor kinase